MSDLPNPARTETDKVVARRHRHWWMPLATVIAATLTVVVIESSPSIDANFRWLFALLTIVLALLLLLIWFTFLSGVRWRTRLAVLACLVLCGIAVGKVVRYDGSADGSAFPRFAWKWTPRRNGNVGRFELAKPLNNSHAVEKAKLDYAGFLGPNRNAVVEGVRLDPDWRAHPPQQLWRHPVGLGWSGFAVSGACAVTQEQRGDNELVVCYELITGEALWVHTNAVHFRESMGGDGPRATPTIVEGRVYSLGGTGVLNCLDLINGRLDWSHDVRKELNLKLPMFGWASSPLVFDNLVIISGGAGKGPSVLAYRRDTGKPLWQSGTNDVGYTSPALATLAGRKQILAITVGHVTAHDPADGRILWDYRWKAADKTVLASQPVILDGDRLFLSAGFFGAGDVLLQISPDKDGQLRAQQLWKSNALKTHFSTAVTREGFAYGLDDGILCCMNLISGKREWKDGRYGRGQLLRVGDLLLIQTEHGPIALAEATPKQFREIAQIPALRAKTWNNPALAGEFLLVRNDQEAACYRLALRDEVVRSSSIH